MQGHSRTKRGLYCPFSSPGVKCRVAVADSAPSVIGDDLVIVMRSAIDNVHRKSRLRTTPSYVHGPVMMQPAYAFLHWTDFFRYSSEILRNSCHISTARCKNVWCQKAQANWFTFFNSARRMSWNLPMGWFAISKISADLGRPPKNVSPLSSNQFVNVNPPSFLLTICQIISDPIWNLHWLKAKVWHWWPRKPHDCKPALGVSTVAILLRQASLASSC